MSDKIGAAGMLGYLRERKSLLAIILIAATGVMLMLFGDATHSIGTTDMETRIEELCEKIDGVSEASVMIVTGADGSVRGVAVVCEGGDDARIQLILTQMITALFGIPSSSVSVVGGK